MSNLKNLPPYYIGQKVLGKLDVQTKSGNHKLKKGKKYIVTGLCFYENRIWTVYLNETGPARWHATLDVEPFQEAEAPLLTFTQIKEIEKQEILILN